MTDDIRNRLAEVLDEHSRYTLVTPGTNECGCGEPVGPVKAWHLHKADAVLAALSQPEQAEEWDYGWTREHAHNGFVYLTEVSHMPSEARARAYVKKHGGNARKRRKAGPWMPVEEGESDE